MSIMRPHCCVHRDRHNRIITEFTSVPCTIESFTLLMLQRLVSDYLTGGVYQSVTNDTSGFIYGDDASDVTGEQGSDQQIDKITLEKERER